MTPQQTIEQLLSDNPNLHVLSQYYSELIASRGVPLKAGPTSHAVPPQIIRYFAEHVTSDHLTIETGSGHTTVALAALARHHVCVTIDEVSVGLIKEYMARIGLPEEKVTFILEPSDVALPKLPAGEIYDAAFIDGGHGFPLPVIDWHYIDKRLKVGGLLGLDNTEIRAVYDAQRFLDENESYAPADRFVNHHYGRRYGTSFYRKLRDDERETWKQPYNLKPAKPPTLRQRLGDIRYRRRKVYPWD